MSYAIRTKAEALDAIKTLTASCNEAVSGDWYIPCNEFGLEGEPAEGFEAMTTQLEALARFLKQKPKRKGKRK